MTSHEALIDDARSGELNISPVEFSVITIAPEGLGFGHGAISRLEREALSGNEDLSDCVERAVNAPEILTPLDRDKHGNLLGDDGCGDGRSVALLEDGSVAEGAVFSFDGQDPQYYGKSLRRAKVIGGGSTMIVSTRIGMGLAEQPLMDTYKDSMAEMARNNVDFGGHIDNHARGSKCGCGAIDLAPEILQATVLYREQIQGVVTILAGESPELVSHESDGVEIPGILDNFAAASAQNKPGETDYQGKDVMGAIIEDGKIIKQLADEHLEVEAVINTIEGMTINQEHVRRETDGRAQVFAVDEWRIRQLAEQMYDDPVQQRAAYLSQLVYTVATLAVLTKGDLRIRMTVPTDSLPTTE